MNKLLSIAAAATMAIGLATAASTASAATPATSALPGGISAPAKAGDVQPVGSRYRYRYGRRCVFVGYRLKYSYYFHRWVKKPVYRCFYRRYYY